MNADRQDAAKLAATINAALAELDLKGDDAQVTKAMTIVTEAFFRYAEGRAATVDALIAKADSVVDEGEEPFE